MEYLDRRIRNTDQKEWLYESCFCYKLVKAIFGMIKRQDFYINKKLKDEKIHFNNGLPDPFHIDIL